MEKTNIQELKRQYLREKEILQIVLNADNHTFEAVLLRSVWKPADIIKLENDIRLLEDYGIHLLLRQSN